MLQEGQKRTKRKKQKTSKRWKKKSKLGLKWTVNGEYSGKNTSLYTFSSYK